MVMMLPPLMVGWLAIQENMYFNQVHAQCVYVLMGEEEEEEQKTEKEPRQCV